MGFLRNIYFYIVIFLSITIFTGCSTSVIKTDSSLDINPYTMFGKTPERIFYYPVTIGDSLKKMWDAEINGSFPNSSVSIYGRYVFVNDLSGRVYCFDMNSGDKIGQLKNKGAVYSTPVLDRDLVIYLSSQNDENISDLCFYNLKESKYLKEIKVSGRALTELVKTDDGIIFTTEMGIVYKYNILGEKLWETDTKAVTYNSPALKDSSIVFGNNNGEIISLNAKDGRIQYRNIIGDYFYGGTSISGSEIFIGDNNGILYSVDLLTGNINWKIKTGARIIITTACDNDNIYIGNLNGDFYSIGKLTGKINWGKKLGSLFNITPLITDNYIILPDQNEKIYFVEKNTGIIKKNYNFKGRLKLSPVIANNKFLFIGYDNGVLEAYEIIN
jgi:outer membrane protein assembly factor BamB